MPKSTDTSLTPVLEFTIGGLGVYIHNIRDGKVDFIPKNKSVKLAKTILEYFGDY